MLRSFRDARRLPLCSLCFLSDLCVDVLRSGRHRLTRPTKVCAAADYAGFLDHAATAGTRLALAAVDSWQGRPGDGPGVDDARHAVGERQVDHVANLAEQSNDFVVP